jgi:hypothetical protein
VDLLREVLLVDILGVPNLSLEGEGEDLGVAQLPLGVDDLGRLETLEGSDSAASTFF